MNDLVHGGVSGVRIRLWPLLHWTDGVNAESAWLQRDTVLKAQVESVWVHRASFIELRCSCSVQGLLLRAVQLLLCEGKLGVNTCELSQFRWLLNVWHHGIFIRLELIDATSEVVGLPLTGEGPRPAATAFLWVVDVRLPWSWVIVHLLLQDLQLLSLRAPFHLDVFLPWDLVDGRVVAHIRQVLLVLLDFDDVALSLVG